MRSFALRLATPLYFSLVVGLIGCSGQPELISPAAKATPKTETTTESTDVKKADSPAATEVAQPKRIDSDVQPATHVVEVALPTIAKRSSLDGPARVAPVLLSAAELKLCKLNVGDQAPSLTLPNLSGQATKFSDLTGDKLTVLVFWNPADPYATWELADLTPDVVKPYESHGVNVVSICAGSADLPVEASVAQAAMELAVTKFPCLLDAQGEALQQFGSDRPSRTYLLDADGKILWFDIEYSRSTRRDLKAALAFLLDKPAKAQPAGK